MAFRFLRLPKNIPVKHGHAAVPAMIFDQRKGDLTKRNESFASRTYSKQVLSYYEVLGVNPKASHSQIKASYYKLSKQYHPDVNKSAEAKVKFSAISEAYETLGNKAKRRDYDRISTGYSGFSGFTGGNVDAEYEEFLKKQGGYKPKGDIPTGRTKIYDFDEFYKAHYDEAIKKKQASNEAKVEYDREVKERSLKNKRHLSMFVGLLVSLALMALRRH